MEKEIYWIWLQCALGAGAKTQNIIERFPDVWQIFKSNPLQLRQSGAFTPRQIEKIAAADIRNAQTAFEVCRKNGWKVITPESEFYPPNMRSMRDMPLVLYVWGDETVLKNPCSVGMVGTRNVSKYGRRAAFSLAAALAECGATVVSGGALGVDSACHEGAMAAGGKTVAFLGCGLGTKYLMNNEALRHDIAKNGAVVSEFMPLSEATRLTFPIRNRLISGMSLATVVVEAGEKSGSLITARLAAEQGRDVFAIPGSVISSAYSGTNKLLRDGARAVFTAADIVSNYCESFPDILSLKNADRPLSDYSKIAGEYSRHLNNPEKSYTIIGSTEKAGVQLKISAEKPKQASLPDLSNVSENARLLYSALSDEAKTPDELSIATGLLYHLAAPALTELEIAGLALRTPGGSYTLG